MKFIKKSFLILVLLSIVLFPILSFAQEVGHSAEGTTTINNPITPNTVNEFILVILQGVIKIGIPVIALAIIYSGFLFVSAQGNSEKLKTAKNAILYSLIGAAILLGSWAIAQLISDTVLSIK